MTSSSSDLKTQAYFDTHTPQWRSDRYEPMIDWLQQNAPAPGNAPGSGAGDTSGGVSGGGGSSGGGGQSLIDIGCGTGNILQLIQQNTPIQNLAGIDITQNYLDQAHKNVGCETHLGSVLDDELCQKIGPQYDYAIMGAVLHHLVGPTRTISKNNAQLAITNAVAMLKPGGYLLIYEPAHYPALMMGFVFWIKRICSMIAPRRIEIGKKWFNLGLPVVSYFTNEQLLAMFAKAGNLEVVEKQYNDPKTLGFCIRRTSSTFVLKKI